MTQSQIEYILAVDKYRNFSKAADACFVTQSTLSALVAKFENQHGVVLFNRKSKPITVTHQGETIIKALKSINREFQLLEEGVRQLKGYESGNISIACIPTVAPYLFPLVLNNLTESHPRLTFHIHEYTTERTVEEIRAGNIDIGIVSTPLGQNDLTEVPVYLEDFLIYDCGNQLQPDMYSVADIDLKRLWLLEEGHCMRNQVKKICELRQNRKLKGNLIYNCGTLFTLIEMVRQNKGITLLPRLATVNNQFIDHNRIHELVPPPVREIGLVTHKNFLRQRMLKDLAGHILNAVSPHLLSPNALEKPVAPF